MADATDLKSVGETRAGSNPASGIFIYVFQQEKASVKRENGSINNFSSENIFSF